MKKRTYYQKIFVESWGSHSYYKKKHSLKGWLWYRQLKKAYKLQQNFIVNENFVDNEKKKYSDINLTYYLLKFAKKNNLPVMLPSRYGFNVMSFPKAQPAENSLRRLKDKAQITTSKYDDVIFFSYDQYPYIENKTIIMIDVDSTEIEYIAKTRKGTYLGFCSLYEENIEVMQTQTPTH